VLDDNVGGLPMSSLDETGKPSQGSTSQSQPSRNWGVIAIIAIIVVAALLGIVGLMVASVQHHHGTASSQADWKSGRSQPAAIRLARGESAMQPVPQSVGELRSWWDTCHKSMCSHPSVGTYPMVVRIGYLKMNAHGCTDLKTGSAARAVMIASTPTNTYTASLARDGNIHVCGQRATGSDDYIVFWTP